MDITAKGKNKATFKPCTLCTSKEIEADHPIHKCSKYKSNTQKFVKLKEIGACTKCSGTSHKAPNCKFKFNKPCFNCKGTHFTFLCMSKIEKCETEKINSGIVEVKCEALNSEIMSSVILPTFTCNLSNGTIIRGMKDTGCQGNFIKECVARKNKLKKIKTVKLTINGFNSSKICDTDVVELNLKVGDKVHKIEALCVPTINSSLILPDLGKVIEGFRRKGYKLADSMHRKKSKKIQNLDMILGRSSNFCLPENNVQFGSNANSVFSETPIGVMLSGNIKTIIDNLPYLPRVSSNCETYVSEETNSSTYRHRGHKRRHKNFRETQTASWTEPEVGWEGCDAMKVGNAMAVSVNFCSNRAFPVLDENDEVDHFQLKEAVKDKINDYADIELNYKLNQCLDYDETISEGNLKEIDEQCVQYALENIEVSSDGRICVPILWDNRVAHSLSDNYKLAFKVLESNLGKYKNDQTKLNMIDEAITEQLQMGIIEKLSDPNSYRKEYPAASFLAHMPVFKMHKESTKCRLVFLSNLAQRNGKNFSVSHNQAIRAGPNLNHKISTSLLHTRFGEFMLTFDLKKAFHMLKLKPCDQIKFSFLWYNNIKQNDYSVVAFKHVRLPMGIRCSPMLLMTALYFMLIVDTKGDSKKLADLKRSIYHHAYMDNLSVTGDSEEQILWAYNQLNSIFDVYGFSLQQFITNSREVQSILPESEHSEETNLFGIIWNTSEDSLYTRKLVLDDKANTKRSILSTIATNYDIYNYNCPLLNRAKLLLHKLQNKKLDWDTIIDVEDQAEWNKICRQLQNVPSLKFQRYVGKKSDEYVLCAFTDSSKCIYGCVIYLVNLTTQKVSFLMALNKLVSKQLESKSIPSLELQAIVLGVETLVDAYKELSGINCVEPVKISDIILCTDSNVCLNWIAAYSVKFDKPNKLSVFVANRLQTICQLTVAHPIQFRFCAGTSNPADVVTRTISYSLLMKTNYVKGMSWDELENMKHNGYPTVTVPPNESCEAYTVAESTENTKLEPLYDLSRTSTLSKAVRVYQLVIKFVKLLKKTL